MFVILYNVLVDIGKGKQKIIHSVAVYCKESSLLILSHIDNCLSMNIR